MKSPKNMNVIQIEITNACSHQCANCTRFCGHHKAPFFMDFDTFKEAVDSMKDFDGVVGIMGGEPTLHPEFDRFVAYFKEHFGRDTRSKVFIGPDKDFLGYICKNAFNIKYNNQRGLWSSMGLQYYKHFELIQDTFGYQVLNDHSHSSMHETLMVTRQELNIPDEKWIKMRNNCWIQNLWSASITPKGAFFCEIAAALDMLMEGPGGWKIEQGWWKRSQAEFADQLHWCELCSAPLAMPKRDANLEIDDASPKWYSILSDIQSPKLKRGKVNLFDVSSYDEKRYSIIDEGTPYLEDQTKRFIRRTGKMEPRSISIWLDLRNSREDEGLQILRNNLEKTEINGIIVSENQQCDTYSPFQIPVMQVSPDSESLKINDLAAAFTSTDFIIILKKYVCKGNPRDMMQYFVYNPGVLYYHGTDPSFLLCNIRASSLKSNPALDTIMDAYPDKKKVRLVSIPDSSVAIYQIGENLSDLAKNGIFRPLPAELSSLTGSEGGRSNGQYSVLASLYWIWKNDPRHEFLGIYGGHSFLVYSNEIIRKEKKAVVRLSPGNRTTIEEYCFDPGSVLECVQDADIIISRYRKDLANRNRESDSHLHPNSAGNQKLHDAVHRYAPDYYPVFHEISKSGKAWDGNQFIIRREMLDSFCAWLFPLLEKIYPTMDFSKYNPDYSEEPDLSVDCLFQTFFEKWRKDHPEILIKEVPLVMIEGTESAASSIPYEQGGRSPVSLSASIRNLDTRSLLNALPFSRYFKEKLAYYYFFIEDTLSRR